MGGKLRLSLVVVVVGHNTKHVTFDMANLLISGAIQGRRLLCWRPGQGLYITSTTNPHSMPHSICGAVRACVCVSSVLSPAQI